MQGEKPILFLNSPGEQAPRKQFNATDALKPGWQEQFEMSIDPLFDTDSAGHLMQIVAIVEAEYVPSAHSLQLPAPPYVLYVPALQATHLIQ